MSDITHEVGTPVVWADTTDYSSTGSGFTRTHQILLEGLTDGQAREGAKADLGLNRARLYSVSVGIEFATAPTAGTSVDFFWSSSHSATAGTGNDGGATGADADFKGGEEIEWSRQWLFLGSLVCTNDATTIVQRATVGYFTSPNRYGQVMVLNASGVTLHSDSAEMYVALVPIVDDVA